MNLFFDIETIPDQRPDAFDRYVSEVKPPANYKKQETIDKWMLDNAEGVALENYRKTSLNGLHGVICSIAFAWNDRDVVQVGIADMGNEKLLLLGFWDLLAAEIQADKNAHDDKRKFALPRWVGHNVIDFDLRFLKQRHLVNGVFPPYLIPVDARHGGEHVFDTMKEWGGWRGYVKQADLVEAFGIQPPDWIDEDILTIDGSKVWDLYREGEYGLISEYNRLDVYYVREIYRRMTYAS